MLSRHLFREIMRKCKNGLLIRGMCFRSMLLIIQLIFIFLKETFCESLRTVREILRTELPRENGRRWYVALERESVNKNSLKWTFLPACPWKFSIMHETMRAAVF